MRTWNLGTGNWNTVLWRAWDEILGSELTVMEWILAIDLWDESEKAERTGKGVENCSVITHMKTIS